MSAKINIKQIDFSPLKRLPGKSMPVRAKVILVGLLAYVGIMMLVLSGHWYGLIDVFTAVPLVEGIFYVAIGLAAVHTYKTQRRHNKKIVAVLKDFAAVNNFSFDDGTTKINNSPGTLFSYGHSQRKALSIGGSLGEHNFKFYEYRYTVGSGKRATHYRMSIMEIDMPRNLPHMVIDSLTDGGAHNGSVLPINFDESQRITLEGDFSEYFHLYAPDDYGVTALSIIAPDAMLVLLKYASKCDIEIVANKLYFYWPSPAHTAYQYNEYFNISAEVLSSIGNKLANSNIFTMAVDQVANSVVHSQASTLRRRPWYKSIRISSVVLFIAIAFVFFRDTEWVDIRLVMAAFLVIVVVAYVLPLVRHMQRASRKKRLYQNYGSR